MPTVNETKLDIMATVLVESLLQGKDSLIEKMVALLNDMEREQAVETKRDTTVLQQRLEKLQNKLDNLLSMRAEGEISKTEYQQAKSKCEEELKALQHSLLEDGVKTETQEGIDLNEVRALLGKMVAPKNGKVDKDLLFELVDSITTERGNVFKWGLWLSKKPSYIRMTTEGRAKTMTAKVENGDFFDCGGETPPLRCTPRRRTSRTPETNRVA